jgi:hypothetical protein
MANEKHLAILKKGVGVWNDWRRKRVDSRPDLSGADLSNIDLRSANLSRADLCEANLNGANLSGAKLFGAEFSGSNLSGARLTSADLNGVDLSEAVLNAADLTYALILHVDFIESILSGADLSHAHIGWSTFAGIALDNVKGLGSVRHAGPSTIGIDTLYKSAGNIPEKFLRGCGVPDDFIAFAHALMGKVIEFYSCFISYSSKNHDFVERLYADLQNKGVRCWFAPEDIKIGDKFRQRIDEAIRIQDKLLLILSEDSMASAWVEDEVEAALERERRENRLVLFPVRIDDAVEQSSTAWAASLRRMRHIGDFSKWKDHDAYSKAFERLLRDLKSESKTL